MSGRKGMTMPSVSAREINKISTSLKGMIVDISTLSLDPNNARVHPERNIVAIRESLAKYGQLKRRWPRHQLQADQSWRTAEQQSR